MQAFEDLASAATLSYKEYRRRVILIFIWFCLGLVVFLGAIALGETLGVSRQILGVVFLFSAITLFAAIGIYCRTNNAQEYFVAGRRIPAVFNGMASAADWMSAATFLSLAGAVYLQGFSGASNRLDAQPGGLAYILGWTGGFCMLALWVAPELRRLELFTVPDFFQTRYGRLPCFLAAWGAILCSFTYLVAQIYGVGLIASYLTGVPFEIGVMLGLGGILVCSFLGGMRAITWTQVAQYVILLLAFLLPVSWLSYKQFEEVSPVSALAPALYGSKMEGLAALEEHLQNDPRELEVRSEYAARAQALALKLSSVEQSLKAERNQLESRLRRLQIQDRTVANTATNTTAAEIEAVQQTYNNLPTSAKQARELWKLEYQNYRRQSLPLGGIPPQAEAFLGETPEQGDNTRLNFFALIVCLMAGTMGLPHILTRYYTTPSVASARSSVAWTLFFVGILYVSIPAMAVLVKFEIMQNLVGIRFSELPSWIGRWSRVDANLLHISDVNQDGLLQFAELQLSPDVMMLLAPDLVNLPYVVSGLVAAGGLAAALSTADGLLLTIGNAFAYDLHPRRRVGTPRSSLDKRGVLASKMTLLLVAVVAALVASLSLGGILRVVAASFSFAAAIFVPSMLMGLYSTRIGSRSASLAMLAGFGVTLFYMLSNSATVQTYLGLEVRSYLWFGIQPISAGIFGLAVGFCYLLIAQAVLKRKSA